MLLLDVNVLIYAHREDAPDHSAYYQWLQQQLDHQQAFGITGIVLSGFLRISTDPRVFKLPTPTKEALLFVESLKNAHNVVHVEPGPRHWSIFRNLLVESDARGKLVPDAWLAAIAIEHACTWVSADTDFARFAGLDWRHPLH